MRSSIVPCATSLTTQTLLVWPMRLHRGRWPGFLLPGLHPGVVVDHGVGFQADQKQRHRIAGELLNEFTGHFGSVGVGVFDVLRFYCSLFTGLFMARSYLHPEMKWANVNLGCLLMRHEGRAKGEGAWPSGWTTGRH